MAEILHRATRGCCAILCKFSGFSTAGFLSGLALSWFILFGSGLFVEFGDFASEVRGQF